MEKRLDVYLQHVIVGQLRQDDDGDMIFTYAESWLKNPASLPLSQSLPLREASFTRTECSGFFAGILPEEGNRELIARNLGISARNDFAMLEQIGGECAGAVTFMPAGQKLPAREDRYRELSENELTKILKELPRHPLLAGDEDIRLSLAGAQDKIAVLVASGTISLPLGHAPSTHILKPANQHFPDLVFNEAFCMRLAESIGCPVAKIETGKAKDIPYLLVDRYDRRPQADDGNEEKPRLPHRLHQEDFCQALGITPHMKYQKEGGPSLKQCFDLLRKVSDAPVIDLQFLLDIVIFNYLIGNHDAHGKNFSLLYSDNGSGKNTTRLAPFYDLLSTVYYPDLTKKMAMKIGGEYESAKIVPRHFDRFAQESGLAKASVKKRVTELAQAILENLDKTEISHEIIPKLTKLIRTRCAQTLELFRRNSEG